MATKQDDTVRYERLDDTPPAAPLVEAFKAQADDENEDDVWPTAEERAANIAQASSLKEAARAGGLRFEAYLPPELAVWFLEMIEQGLFDAPSQAAFVLLGEAHELHPHDDLRKELLRRTLQAAMDDHRPSIPAEEAFKRLREELSAPLPEPALWKKKTP
jgi:antitoxin ParD1/3/4